MPWNTVKKHTCSHTEPWCKTFVTPLNKQLLTVWKRQNMQNNGNSERNIFLSPNSFHSWTSIFSRKNHSAPLSLSLSHTHTHSLTSHFVFLNNTHQPIWYSHHLLCHHEMKKCYTPPLQTELPITVNGKQEYLYTDANFMQLLKTKTDNTTTKCKTQKNTIESDGCRLGWKPCQHS